MSYLVGRGDRFYGKIEFKKVITITREHLANAKKDDSYNVINLNNLTWYDPEANEWKDI